MEQRMQQRPKLLDEELALHSTLASGSSLNVRFWHKADIVE